MPLKSKKFAAYLLSELGWKISLFYVLYQYSGKIEHYSFMILLSIVITSGFIQVGYILGQAALDKYALLAEQAIPDKQVSTKDAKESIARFKEGLKNDNKSNRDI